MKDISIYNGNHLNCYQYFMLRDVLSAQSFCCLYFSDTRSAARTFARMSLETPGGGLETSEVEIPITIGGTTRWMQGLTKLTTCDDIVYSLLCSMANPSQGDPGAIVDYYGLFETYGDQERKLSGRTKILRVWHSWGPESTHVRFSLRKICDDYDQVTPPSESDSGFGSTSSTSSVSAISRVCGRREMRSRRTKQLSRTRTDDVQIPPALVHLPPESPPDVPSRVSGAQLEHTATMQQLMSLILAQENRVQDIHRRITDIDSQIESYEANLHHMRVKEEGPNYLQNAYLSGVEVDSGANRTKLGTDLTGVSSDELQYFVDMSEDVLQLTGQLETENGKIEDYSLQIQDESFLDSFVKSPQHHKRLSPSELTLQLDSELDRTRRDVQSSRSICSENSVHMEWIDASLKDCAAQLAEKNIILAMLQEHDRGVCETIEEVSENPDETVIAKEALVEPPSHSIIPEPLCSSTPNSERSSPVLNLQQCPTAKQLIQKMNSKTTSLPTSNSYIKTHTSQQNHLNSLSSTYDPSLTVIAPDSSMGSMYGVIFTTDLGCKSPGSDTDTTSDTGLSSMHSTTSDDVAYTTLETLV